MADNIPTQKLANHFRRVVRKGPKIQCRFCTHEIEANPIRGINDRRREHLKHCPDFINAITESPEFKEEVVSGHLHTSDKHKRPYDEHHNIKQGGIGIEVRPREDTIKKENLEEESSETTEMNERAEYEEEDFPDTCNIEDYRTVDEQYWQGTLSCLGLCDKILMSFFFIFLM
jgi:hypothetical protein